VAHEVIERSPTRRVQGRRDEKSATRPCNPRQLRQRAIIVVDVLYDIERAYQVECIVRERQGCHLAQHDVCVAPAKLRKRGCADIHKLSTFEG
jgi:hypothetical protein